MRPTLSAVMVYENATVAKLAKEKWNYVVHTLQSSYDFELRLWKFDALRIPEWRVAATNDAAQAQLVFVASRGAGDLPPEVKEWIEQWLAMKDRVPDATRLLSAVFDPASDSPDASAFSQVAYLQEAACRGSMDFIALASPLKKAEPH